MKHIASVDKEEGTVIMIQIETKSECWKMPAIIPKKRINCFMHQFRLFSSTICKEQEISASRNVGKMGEPGIQEERYVAGSVWCRRVYG